MKIGGYQIIDFKGKNLTTDVGMVYEGIYELIEGTRKPVLLSGIQVDDTEYQDVFTSVTINESAFELKAYNKIFTINDNDVVVVSADNSGGDSGGGGDVTEKITIYVNNTPVKVYKDTILNNIFKLGNFISNISENTAYYIATPYISVNDGDVLTTAGFVVAKDNLEKLGVKVWLPSSLETSYFYKGTGDNTTLLHYTDVFEDAAHYTISI